MIRITLEIETDEDEVGGLTGVVKSMLVRDEFGMNHGWTPKTEHVDDRRRKNKPQLAGAQIDT